jgi:hypothetical protein
MSRTIAESFIEQGRVEGLLKGRLKQSRSTLLMLLKKQFKKVPAKMKARIASTTDLHQLKTWLVSFVNAKSLEDVGIPLD